MTSFVFARDARRHTGTASPSRIFPVLLLFASLAACDPKPLSSELPAFPEIDTTQFLPIIQRRLQDAQDAAERQPRDAEAIGRLGMLLHAHDQWGAAELAYRRARMLAPREPRWLYYHAIALSALGKNRDAIEVLRYAVDEGRSDTSMRVLLATLLFESNDVEAARDLLVNTLAETPGAARAHFVLGRLLVQVGELELARQHLEQTIDLAGHFSPAYYVLGQLYRQLGDEAQAQDMFAMSEQYREIPAQDDDPMLAEVLRLNLSDIPMLASAEVAARQGQLLVAIDMLTEAIRRNPKSHAAHTTLVGLYATLKQFDKADEHFEIARALDPDSGKLQYNLGLARLWQGRRDEAMAAFTRAIEFDSLDANPHVQLGLINAQSGRLDEAIEHLKSALALQPQNRQANWLFGYVLVEQGDYSTALKHLEDARGESDFVTPLVLESMARAYQGLGDAVAARAALTEALDIAKTLDDLPLQQRLYQALSKMERSASNQAVVP